MRFLDVAKVYANSGAGGNGCIAFRREKFMEYGDPMAAMAAGAAMSWPKRSRTSTR